MAIPKPTLSRKSRILLLLAIDTCFFFTELVLGAHARSRHVWNVQLTVSAGYVIGSLALVADSFHMLNDVLSLVVALYAIKVRATVLRRLSGRLLGGVSWRAGRVTTSLPMGGSARRSWRRSSTACSCSPSASLSSYKQSRGSSISKVSLGACMALWRLLNFLQRSKNRRSWLLSDAWVWRPTLLGSSYSMASSRPVIPFLTID